MVDRYISNVLMDKNKQYHINVFQNNFSSITNEFHLSPSYLCNALNNTQQLANSKFFFSQLFNKFSNYAKGPFFVFTEPKAINLQIFSHKQYS